MNNKKEIVITDDLKPILGVLKEKDAQIVLELKEELTDNWLKKQIFRTETEMRVSVLNDAKHPTNASKYWQSVREMSTQFDAMMSLSFNLRRNSIKRLKLEAKLERAIESGDKLKIMSVQVDLDENLFNKAKMEQFAKDRVRELQEWSKIKNELSDGSFDDKNPNTHQAESLMLTLENRVKSLGPNDGSAEIINAIGPLQTIKKLKTEDNKILGFRETSLKLKK